MQWPPGVRRGGLPHGGADAQVLGSMTAVACLNACMYVGVTKVLEYWQDECVLYITNMNMMVFGVELLPSCWLPSCCIPFKCIAAWQDKLPDTRRSPFPSKLKIHMKKVELPLVQVH